MNKATVARNIVLTLQRNPADYKKFGVYWWAIKRALKGAGYNRDALTVLGDYEDPRASDLIAETDPDEIIKAALREYAQSHFTGIYESEDKDGERYVCWDADAGGL